MLDQGRLEAIIVKVATLGLDQSHLGKSLDQIRLHLHKMVKHKRKIQNTNEPYV
jgi:diphthamide synthase (EF-2-diphthine--ammonia ligase)